MSLDFRTVCLPYCLQKLDNGKYVVLNRQYKPIGFNNNKWVEYDNYPICSVIPGLRSNTASIISFDGNENINSIYLYNDNSIPTRNKENMEKYMKKLSHLANFIMY